MPELPEVETIARTLAPLTEGRVVGGVRVLLSKTLASGKELLPNLFPGARIHRVRRRAKLLLMDLAAPGAGGPTHCMAFHLKMTGRLFVYGAEAVPGKHTRMVFDLEPEAPHPASRLFFDDTRTFGYCRIMAFGDLLAWPFWAGLGPEPLTLSPAEFSRALGNRKAGIKSLLLNQSVIAGIGNIYADEACFRSRVHPATSAASLSEKERAELLGNVRDVLEESIRECGSSIRDYRDANGDAGAFQNLFKVYGRAGQACVACGAPLEKTTVAARTTVFCPNCQKK